MKEIITIDGECTVDPIFVLMERFWTCSDPQCEDKYDPPCTAKVEKCPLGLYPDRYCIERAERVFLTRKEGEDYGESQSHNLGKKEVGWYIWCIPAMGELASFLRTVRKVR